MSYKGFLGSNSRISKEDQEFYELKNKAAEFYRESGMQHKIEDVLNKMFFDQPDDIYGYLANYFSKWSTTPVISRVMGKYIFNGKGQLSVQAEIFCMIKNEEKKTCSAEISSVSEVLEDNSQDPGIVPGNGNKSRDVIAALHWINDPLSTMLKGCNPCDQEGVDKILSDFFMARYLEDMDLRNREKTDQSPSELLPDPLPPAAIATSKDKKGGDKGKKGNIIEKPIPPPEHSEPVLPGSVAVGTVSLAVAKTGALLQGIPLYKYITILNSQKSMEQVHVPLPLVTLLSCGRNSPGKLNLLEEVILIPKSGQRFKPFITKVLELQKEMTGIMNAASKTGPVLTSVSDLGALVVSYERPEQPLDLVTEACNNIGLALGKDIHLAINCAAQELMDYAKGKYDVMTGTPKSPDELVDLYEALINKYPAIIALINPLRKEDLEQWEKLNTAIGASCILLCDITSRPPRNSVQDDALPLPGVKGYILKQTNEMTVSELIRVSRRHKGAVIIGTTYGEPCSDDSLADVAVGVGADYVKLGGLSRGERLNKYNRLISIEEELAQQGILDLRKQHTFLFVSKPEEQSSA
ncbi:enolase 4 [Osmerus mordax]|uniref:enolase 4 n=1 Tax=Osmerus mordax TaxID=8014 RepID=UPI00350F2E64